MRSPLARTALVTFAIYAVLAAVLSGNPPDHLPPALAFALRAVPFVIAGTNAAALFLLLGGWRAIRAGRLSAHRRSMLAAAACISLFLLLYVTRVALGGTKAFPGPAGVRAYVYLPLLGVHILLSILSVPLVVYNLLVGLGTSAAEVARTAHPRVGRWAVLLWSVSLALGIVVFLLLNVIY
ncbi:MAG: DUF420 domain-containing protein [Armatimonadota bacterium]|nr:DUF420 domain-containing protein [Armatimonadota bacterium]